MKFNKSKYNSNNLDIDSVDINLVKNYVDSNKLNSGFMPCLAKEIGVPFALKNEVEREISSMVEKGFLVPFYQAVWQV